MQSRTLAVAAAIVTATALFTTACSAPKPAAPPTMPYTTGGVSLFGTDGIMSNDFGDDLLQPGILGGMSGTAALTPLSPTFTNRLLKIDPTLDSFNYAGEAYDAVIITALAAQEARSVDGATIATYIDGVTESGAQCDDVASCFQDIADGTDFAYRGITVTSGFTKSGEPSTASFGTLHFGSDNRIDPEKTEYVSAGDPATATTNPGPAPAPISYYGGKPLTLGLLLPKTGDLASDGKPIIAGVELAVADINAAGGVLKKDVQTEFQDDGTAPAKAVAGAKKLIADGVPVIIGPSSSDAVESVLPLAVKAHVVLFSPSATAAGLSTLDDDGLFFRTAPSDSLQALALADVITRSGARRVFIVARSDSYGTGLEEEVTTALNADGIESGDLTSAEYSADANADNTATYAQIAAEIAAFHADSVLLIGYSEISGMITAMASAHLTFNAA